MQFEWISEEHNDQAIQRQRDTINLLTLPAIIRRMQTVTLCPGNLKSLK
jgi:hypothetical protein